MAADKAVNEAAGAAKGLVGKVANQFNPMSGGKLRRNLMITTALAGVGVAAGFATGGVGLPFATAVSTTVAAPGATAGTAVATTAATNGLWGAVGSAAAEFGAHAVNGGAYIGQTAIDIVQNGDFPAFFEAMGQAGNALAPPAAA